MEHDQDPGCGVPHCGMPGRHEQRFVGTNDGDDWDDPTVRHGDFEQVDWDMKFVSALTTSLSRRVFDESPYEVARLEWADSVMTLVVRVWRGDDSGLIGWQEHLPTVRSGFGGVDPARVAGAWHTGEFYPCCLPEPFLPDGDGIHWIGTGRPSHPGNLR